MGLRDFFSRRKEKSDIDNFSEIVTDIQPCDFNTGTVGVILTSTSLLAQKYSCRQKDVEDVIQKFQNDSRSIGNTWLLCDVSGSDWDYIFKNGGNSSTSDDGGVRVSKKVVSWKLYAEALQDFCAGMELRTTAKTPLLIVGGDDVIPVPMEDIEYKVNGRKEEAMPQVDMKYCFPKDFDLFGELEKEKQEKEKRPNHSISTSILEKAKFNVARIPLESGRLGTTVWNDLGGYFDKVINSGKSVTVNSAVACAAEIFAPGTEDITLSLPLVDDNVKFSGRKVFISPPVDLEKSSTINTTYKEAISKADMFFSGLHGDTRFNNPEYSGQPSNCRPEYPPAFFPYLTLSSQLKVILSLSCYGARYIEYARDVSTLLTAMYNEKSGVLLFMGSSQVAWGPRADNYRGLTCSESFMQMYIMYLIEGKSAGYALLKAKLDYFDKNYHTDENITYLTLVEFNLFGDPTLYIKFPPRSMQTCKALLNKSINAKKGPYTGTVSYKTIYDPNDSVGQNHGNYSGNSFDDIYERLKNKNNSIGNIYEDVHSAVDANLRKIEQQLMVQLFGKSSRDYVKLAKIDEIYVNGALNGYRYLFETGNDSFRQQTLALVDKTGNIINSMSTI